MNQRAMVTIEIIKNEHSYTLLMPMGAPIGEAYDVVHEMLQAVVGMANNAAAKAAPQAPEMQNCGALEPEVVS